MQERACLPFLLLSAAMRKRLESWRVTKLKGWLSETTQHLSERRQLSGVVLYENKLQNSAAIASPAGVNVFQMTATVFILLSKMNYY